MRKLALLVLGLLGCGGGSSETQPSHGPLIAEVDAAAAEPATVDAAAAPPKETIDSRHDDIIKGCMSKVGSPGYCACFFDQFKAVLKDTDVHTNPTDAQLATIQAAITSTCVAKLTEDEVKKFFMATCVVGDDRNAPYCTCAYPAFRKKLELGDFVSEPPAARLEDAKKSVVAACKGKLPEEVEKANFMRSCTSQAPGAAATCECVWKKLRTKTKVMEEIVVGLVDLKPEELESCKK